MADERVFTDEVRDGYTVSAEMKAVWATQLDLLARLQAVCEAHGLHCFAAGGTLLGAVRHGGYIPWDDDIDVVMFREDYERLCAVAAEAFPAPYFFQTAETDEQYSRGHAQLRHSNTAAVIAGEGRHYPFNQGIFIDIFPLDAVPDDEEERRRWAGRIRFWERMLNIGVRYPSHPDKTWAKNLLHRAVSLVPYRWIFRRMVRAATRYNGTPTALVAPATFMPLCEEMRFFREDYAASERVPFEEGTITIPAGYDRILRIQYGDYQTPRQAPTYHGEITFDVGRSYKDYLK